MARAAQAKGRSRRGETRLADRLLALFGFELLVIERSVAPLRAGVDEDGSCRAASGAKARIEAISQMTRTLEKLFELKGLETLALGGGEALDAEAERLAEELMRRLRVLDRRRRAAAADPADPDEEVRS